MTAYQFVVLLGAIIIMGSSGLLMLKTAIESEYKGTVERRSAEGWWGARRVGDGKLDLERSVEPLVDIADHGADKWAGVKWLIDCVASVALLVLFMPILIVTAIAIKLNSKGPVLYRQKRIGYRGRNFDVFKFRSMAVDAEKDGPQYATPNDHRVTRVGRWIRKTRIDEIPQTINVLRGEMSFVGPRPERPEFVTELEKAIPQYHCRHTVKPGITGWAQVKYEYAASVEGAREKLRYDLYYIRNFTPLLDIVIILMTVRVAFFGIGSR
ncbi:MAG: exopolysaccharide biosynthesis polyprenyl glycosylphosphotransferase [Alphaproteobacteria bacterium]|nr:exopolysaccharide biosynthesis polyprenyl glycosylphosphotransferase [Alphaproteobacteria bacterium]